MRSVLPNEEYFGHDVSSSRHGLSQGSINEDSILNKMNSLGLENNDNMAMLETDSVEDEYRLEGNNSRLSSP